MGSSRRVRVTLLLAASTLAGEGPQAKLFDADASAFRSVGQVAGGA